MSVASLFGKVALAAGAAGAFLMAWWPEILLGCCALFMIYMIWRHGRKGSKHPHFEWAKLGAEFAHLFRHPNPIGVAILLVGILTMVFGGHFNDNHHNDDHSSKSDYDQSL